MFCDEGLYRYLWKGDPPWTRGAHSQHAAPYGEAVAAASRARRQCRLGPAGARDLKTPDSAAPSRVGAFDARNLTNSRCRSTLGTRLFLLPMSFGKPTQVHETRSLEALSQPGGAV